MRGLKAIRRVLSVPEVEIMTAVMGMILFHEPATVARIVCILLVVSGIVGLVILEGHHGA